MTDDLAAFISARLDEDQRAADGLYFAARIPDRRPDFTGCGGPAAEAYWERFEPARILREAAAMRAILAQWQASPPESPVLTHALYELAAIWSDHPDYRPGWKP